MSNPKTTTEKTEATKTETDTKVAESKVEETVVAEETQKDPAKVEELGKTDDAPAPKVEEVPAKVAASSSNESFAEVTETESKPVVKDEKSSTLDMGDEELIEKFLTSPRAVMKQLREEVLADLRKDDQDRKVAKDSWNAFFETNADLVKVKDLVKLKTEELKAKWGSEKKQVSWEEGSKVLATEVRAMVRRVREASGDVEEVSDEHADLTSSSGNPAPETVTKKAERKSFTNQIRSFQATKQARG